MKNSSRQKLLLEILKKINVLFNNEEIDYWIIGGVAVAGYYGKFFRENEDIDLIIWKKDFNSLSAKLIKTFDGFEICQTQRNGRDRIYIKKNRQNYVDIMPIEDRHDKFYLKLADDPPEYSKNNLEINILFLNKIKFCSPRIGLLFDQKKRYKKYLELNNMINDKRYENTIKDITKIKEILKSEKINNEK